MEGAVTANISEWPFTHFVLQLKYLLVSLVFLLIQAQLFFTTDKTSDSWTMGSIGAYEDSNVNDSSTPP